MALDTASEFKKHKDTRKVTFKKDYKGSNGKVRYAAGKVYYMHKDFAKKVDYENAFIRCHMPKLFL